MLIHQLLLVALLIVLIVMRWEEVNDEQDPQD
jgi:hypothetical protein